MHPTHATRYSLHHFRTALTVTAATAAAGALLYCFDATSIDKSGTFFGPVTAMASGSARSYVTLDRFGAPTDLGVALTEAALTGLPTAMAEYVLALPTEASATLFKHAVINWMPMGHPPPMVYTVPHFDFHFYMITNDERVAIVVGDPKLIQQPAAEFVPAGFVVGAASAGMGLHWRDPDAPEMHGEPFTKTFIHGSYDGVLIFGEPMVAKDYLETRPAAVATPLKLPTQYAVRGRQATSYIVGYDAGSKEYRIALSGLVQR